MIEYGRSIANPTKIAEWDADSGNVFYRYHQGRTAGLHGAEVRDGGDNLLGMYRSVGPNSGNPNFDIPMQSKDTEAISDRWTNGIVTDSLVVTDAAMAELQAYWEQNLVYTYIAKTYLTETEILATTVEIGPFTYWSESQQKYITIDEWEYVTVEGGLAKDYYEGGAAAVEATLSVYFDKPDVQAAFAESALFLSLTENQRLEYTQMSRDDQYAMLFEAAEDYDSYMGSRQVVDLVQMNTKDLIQDQYHPIDLTEIGEALAEQGIDGHAWFMAEYTEQTQSLYYEAVTDAVDPIVRLYYGVLDRVPDEGGLEWWIHAFNSDDSKVIEQMGADFAWSVEFLGDDIDLEAGPTAEQLVTALYENVLGRAPDDDGYDWWLNKAELAFEYDLRAGTVPGTAQTTWLSPDDEEVFTFGRIVTGFTESEEYIEQTVVDVYAAEVAIWGVNLKDLVDEGEAMGFETDELIGVEMAVEDFFLVG